MNLLDINTETIEIEGIDKRDYPDMSDSYAVSAEFKTGQPLNDEQLDQLNDEGSEIIQELARERAF